MEYNEFEIYVKQVGNFKCAINDPIDKKLKLFKVEAGKGLKWNGYIFITELLDVGSKISIKDWVYREQIKSEIIKHFPDCILKYKRESKEYTMSNHPINFEPIELMLQNDIEKILIPAIWSSQTIDEQNLRKTIENNKIGLSKSDAGFFSHIVKDRLEVGISLNEIELENCKRRLCKYKDQLIKQNKLKV